MKRPGGNRWAAARLVALLALLSVVPLAFLAYFSVHLASGAVRREVEAGLSSNVALSAVAIEEEMQGLAELVESSASRPALIDALRTPEPSLDEDLVSHLTDLRQARPGIVTAFLAAPDGTLIQIVPATPSIIGKDFSFRDWYRGTTSTGLTYLSEAYESQATGHPRVVAAATLVRAPGEGSAQGRAVGILVAAYDLGAVQRFVTEFAAALRGVSGVSTREGPDGSALSPIPGIGWTVTASLPESEALQGVVRLRSTVLVIAGLLLVALLVGLAFLDRALRARRRAEDESRESRAFLDSIVENIPHMIFVKDAELLSAGARAYLTKPLDVRRLLETIKEILIEGRLDHAG